MPVLFLFGKCRHIFLLHFVSALTSLKPHLSLCAQAAPLLIGRIKSYSLLMSDRAHVGVLASAISPVQHQSTHIFTQKKRHKSPEPNHLNIEKRRLNHWVSLTKPSNPQIPGCYRFPLDEPPLQFPCWCTPSSLPFTSPLAVLHLCQNSMGCFRVVETAAWQWNWYPSPSSSQATCRHSGTYQCDWWVGWTAGGTLTLIKSKHPQQIGQWWTNKSTTPPPQHSQHPPTKIPTGATVKRESEEKKTWCNLRQSIKVRLHCISKNKIHKTVLN